MNRIKTHYVLKQLLYYIYHFDKWHLYKLDNKKYVEDIIEYVNSTKDIQSVLEIGCGLGDIIGNLKAKKCMGLDTSPQAVKAAKLLFPKTNFLVGSFEQISHKKIDCLITVNFMHGIPKIDLQKYYADFCKKNYVRYIIFDSVVSKRYEHSHKAEDILGENWILEKHIGRYAADGGYRKINVYKHISHNRQLK